MPKHNCTYYEYGNVSCDMRNPRKRFFEVMCGDVQLADIDMGGYERGDFMENEEFYEENYLEYKNKFFVVVSVKDGFSEEDYKDFLHIFSQITKDNPMNYVDLSGLRLMHGDKKNKFPKFRRKRVNGVLQFTKAITATPHNLKKALNGNFISIKHNDNVIYITREEYDNILKLDEHIKVDDNYHTPLILYKNMKMNYHELDINAFYVDNIHIIGDLTFDFEPQNRVRAERMRFIIGDLDNHSLKLPKLNNPPAGLELSFCDANTLETVNISDLTFNMGDNEFNKSHCDFSSYAVRLKKLYRKN